LPAASWNQPACLLQRRLSWPVMASGIGGAYCYISRARCGRGYGDSRSQGAHVLERLCPAALTTQQDLGWDECGAGGGAEAEAGLTGTWCKLHRLPALHAALCFGMPCNQHPPARHDLSGAVGPTSFCSFWSRHAVPACHASRQIILPRACRLQKLQKDVGPRAPLKSGVEVLEHPHPATVLSA